MATMFGDISHSQQCNELGVYEGEGVLRLKAISNNNYPGSGQSPVYFPTNFWGACWTRQIAKRSSFKTSLRYDKLSLATWNASCTLDSGPRILQGNPKRGGKYSASCADRPRESCLQIHARKPWLHLLQELSCTFVATTSPAQETFVTAMCKKYIYITNV